MIFQSILFLKNGYILRRAKSDKIPGDPEGWHLCVKFSARHRIFNTLRNNYWEKPWEPGCYWGVLIECLILYFPFAHNALCLPPSFLHKLLL